MAALQLHHDASPMEDDVSASKNKLCLKIKIPNNISSHVPEQRDGGEVEGHIICEYCGKRFSSGKAWGGHKRHHLQMRKKPKLQQPPKVLVLKKKQQQRCRTIYAGDCTIKDGRPTCCLCSKVFPSLNSLFSHMRFHPEREWREIEPGFEDDVKKGNIGIDLSSQLVGWLKKDKRGRVCISDLIPQAAHNLITLSRWCAAKSENTRTTDPSAYGNVIESSLLNDAEGIHNQFNWEICNKDFTTGQASAMPRVFSSSRENNINGMLTLDLNKPYNEDGDDEDTTNNLFSFNGYSTSC